MQTGVGTCNQHIGLSAAIGVHDIGNHSRRYNLTSLSVCLFPVEKIKRIVSEKLGFKL